MTVLVSEIKMCSRYGPAANVCEGDAWSKNRVMIHSVLEIAVTGGALH